MTGRRTGRRPWCQPATPVALLALLALLAGCGASHARHPASAPAAVTSSAGSRSPTCAQLAMANHYIQIQSVSAGAGQKISIAYQVAKLVCGGFDDSHYRTSGLTLTTTVSPSMPVQVLDAAIAEQQITAAQLPGRFSHLLFGPTFLVAKDTAGTIISLQQQYHP
jgi:hypothetical protein